MHVLIPLYPERKGGATEIKFPTGWHLYYKQTFRYCKYERSTIDSGKGQDLFIQRMLFPFKFSVYGWKKKHVICHFPGTCKLIHYVWYVISPALVMEIRRNNSNTCTTAEETLYKANIPIYKIQPDHTNDLILNIYFSWFTPCTEDEGESFLRSKLKEPIPSI